MSGAPRKIALDALLVCWGLGTWLGVNALFVQLPLLVERLPEQWALPSSMTVAIQLANVGLLVYAVVRKFTRVPDSACIYALLTVGTAALFLNAFLYSETAYIGSTERSVAFLVLTFFVALVGCTSSVLFYPYLRHFREIYLYTYLIGEGLSGFIPSILALIQGVGGDPECVLSADNSTMTAVYPPALFSSTVFISLMGVLLAMSLTSFTILHNYSGFSTEKVKQNELKTEKEVANEEQVPKQSGSLLQKKWIAVMVLMACLNAVFNGVMPSVQSYSCMPYGTVVYHLAVTLGAMANPVACLAGVFFRPVRVRYLSAMLVATVAVVIYITITAAQSPAPPLYEQTIGAIITVVCWVLASGLISYARMWIYAWARLDGARGMRAIGAVGQVGSALGSLTLFLIVNFANVFEQAETCPMNIAM